MNIEAQFDTFKNLKICYTQIKLITQNTKYSSNYSSFYHFVIINIINFIEVSGYLIWIVDCATHIMFVSYCVIFQVYISKYQGVMFIKSLKKK